MNDLEIYEEHLAKRYNASDNYHLPLSCWEFYGEHFLAKAEFRKDIESLTKLSNSWALHLDFYNELIVNKNVVVVTDPTLKIVYASHNLERMNGFLPTEVIGKTPKMFQGEQTCPSVSKKIRKAIDARQSFEESVINYRKDKSIYLCTIKGFPVLNYKGELINYVALEKAA
ncbi:PAS domain-containing protein [Aquimarina sp. W85]|uniref:PAS domain-containing protein n=1 Tax=Aquimarina rhodophyticola TaxID=3342246 RepID=UPI003672E064